jgi:flagellar basal-body rod modification protein FlgD
VAITSVNEVTTQSATGLEFKSLLQIILQQLTYQDPLKPMDNFQFVSQLAQFSQLQQAQTLNDSIGNLLTSQASLQATGLLGRTVTFQNDGAPGDNTGKVSAVKFDNGQMSLHVTIAATADKEAHTVTDVRLSSITQIVNQ